MVAWQIERGAGGCLSFEELNSTVSVLSAFSWSLFSNFQSFMSEPSVVWQPITKRAHTQLVREHSVTVVSSR